MILRFDLLLTIVVWAVSIGLLFVVLSLLYALFMFLVACGLYVITYFQSKIDLKTINSEKFENRIYIDEAKFITENQKHQDIIDGQIKYRDELQAEIRKLAAKKKSEEAAANKPATNTVKKGTKK